MVIKKYIAKTEEEAAKLAREELGEDVVIMNVKKNEPKGLWKLFKKPFIELTAAVDDIPQGGGAGFQQTAGGDPGDERRPGGRGEKGRAGQETGAGRTGEGTAGGKPARRRGACGGSRRGRGKAQGH